jgi:hypothetical protein
VREITLNPAPNFVAKHGCLALIYSSARLARIYAERDWAGRMPAVLIAEHRAVTSPARLSPSLWFRRWVTRITAPSSEMATIFAHVFGDLAAPLNI